MEVKTSEWLRTDDMQLVCVLDANNFVVLDSTCFPDDTVAVTILDIDLQDYIDEDTDSDSVYFAKKYLNSYGYDTLQVVKDLYGEDWGLVCAECIAEQISHIEGDIAFKGFLPDADIWLEEVWKNKTHYSELLGYEI